MQKKTLHTVAYWTYGSSKSRPIIFVHGFTGSHEGFQYILPMLRNNYYCIVPDVPGFGVSPLIDRPWTTESLAVYLNEYVEKLGLIEPPVLISHSLGGLIAAAMLADRPDLYAKKTVFISPVATKINHIDSRKLGALAARAQYFIGAKTGALGVAITKSHVLSRIATYAIMTEKRPQMRKTIYQHHFKNLEYISSIEFYHQLYCDIIKRGALDYKDALGKFDTLIIAGDKDNVTPLAGERLLASTIGAKLEIIEGVGHLAHYEKPEAIATGVCLFLG